MTGRRLAETADPTCSPPASSADGTPFVRPKLTTSPGANHRADRGVSASFVMDDRILPPSTRLERDAVRLRQSQAPYRPTAYASGCSKRAVFKQGLD
jgi:hypothetical protein